MLRFRELTLFPLLTSIHSIRFALLGCVITAGTPQAVTAGMILDFEGTRMSQGDTVGTVDGVSFSSTLFVVQGDPTFAFASPFGGDTGGSGSFAQTGNGFIVAGPINDHNQTLTMDFSSYGTVSDLSFDVVDIDVNDVFSAKAFDIYGNLLQQFSLSSGAGDPGTGNGVVTTIAFTVSGIATVETLNFRAADAGHGIDNIAFETVASVPEPASFAMLGMSLLGLAGARRCKLC